MKTNAKMTKTATKPSIGTKELYKELGAHALVVKALCELAHLEQLHRGNATTVTTREALKAIARTKRLLNSA